MPDFVLLLFTFSLSFQISPRQPKEHVLFANKLSVHTSNILVMHYLTSPKVFKDSPNFLGLNAILLLLLYFLLHMPFPPGTSLEPA